MLISTDLAGADRPAAPASAADVLAAGKAQRAPRAIMRLLPLVAAACLGCEQAEVKPAVAYDTTLSTAELMAHVIDPAAREVWSHAGWIMDANGETALFPTIEAEWAAAENAAAMVAEAGNMLLLPGRQRVLAEDDNGDWVRFARTLSERAHTVRAATEARQPQAMFDAGGDLYQACVACHEKYYAPFLQD